MLIHIDYAWMSYELITASYNILYDILLTSYNIVINQIP